MNFPPAILVPIVATLAAIAGIPVARGDAAHPTLAWSEPMTTLPDSILRLDPATGRFLDRHGRASALAGRVDPSEVAVPGAGLRFHVALRMRNLTELRARLARGEIISQSEMTAKYYPLPRDWTEVADWLAARGLTVSPENAGAPLHLGVAACGTLEAISRGLGVAFAPVRGADGRTYNSAISPPCLPTRLAKSVIGVIGLQPHIHALPQQALIPVTPERQGLQSGGVPYDPPQYYQTFGPLALLNYYHGLSVAHGGALAFDGTGQTIAIMMTQDDVATLQSDLVAFWAGAGLSHTLADLTVVDKGWYAPVAGQNAWNNAVDSECTLDLEWASGMAEGAKLRLYETIDASVFVPQIIADRALTPKLNQASVSIALPEDLGTPAYETDDSNYYAALAAAGVTMFAPTGDWGSSPITTGPEAGQEADYPASPPSAYYPACDPSVVAVGGTNLYFPDTGTPNPDGSGDLYDSTAPLSEYGWPSSGGGYSQVFGRPSWQIGLGANVTANVDGNTGPAMRTVPDVATVANGGGVGFYVVETGQVDTHSGTSFSSPMWAGICAVLNQARAQSGLPALGLLAPKLYAIAAGSQGNQAFNDITPDLGPYGEYDNSNGAYSVGPGYDLVTGIGSPNIAGLIAALDGLAAAAGPPVILTEPESISVDAGGTALLAAVADAVPPPAFQWQSSADGGITWTNLSDGGGIAGSATAALTVSGATASLNGSEYECVISNADGSVTTIPVSLAVDYPISIAAQPSSITVAPGSDASITIAAGGNPPPNYQWQLSTDGGATWNDLTNGGAVSGATSATLVIAGVSSAENGYNYRCALANAQSSGWLSNAATLTVSTGGGGGGNSLPSITVQPASQIINSGSTVTFVASAAAPPTFPGIIGTLSYQWQFDGANLSDGRNGATLVAGSGTSQMVITGARGADAGSYSCIVIFSTNTGSAVAVATDAANLTVQAASTPGYLVNLSARGFVGTGSNILIGGFYIVGSTSRTVLIQALGPALAGEGVSGVLLQPELTIHDSTGATIYSNTGWGSNPVLLNAAAAAYANPVLQAGSGDSEVLLTLPPGGYTAEISGADGGTGVALCAVYELP